MADASKNNTALLLGMGLDGRDEHRRITGATTSAWSAAPRKPMRK